MKTGLLGSRPAVDDSWRGAEGIREWSSKHDFLSLFVCFSSKIWSLSCSCEVMMKTTTTMRRRRTMMGGGGVKSRARLLASEIISIYTENFRGLVGSS